MRNEIWTPDRHLELTLTVGDHRKDRDLAARPRGRRDGNRGHDWAGHFPDAFVIAHAPTVGGEDGDHFRHIHRATAADGDDETGIRFPIEGMGGLYGLHTGVGFYVGEGICRDTRVAEKPQDAVKDAGFGNAGI